MLLSATGTLAFKNCGLSDEVSTFTAPEMLQGRASSTKPAIERVSACILIPVPTPHKKVDGRPVKLYTILGCIAYLINTFEL